MLYVIGLLTFSFTFLGGFFALKFKDKLHLILGFSAGAVISVAFFDLIPEAVELSGKSSEMSQVTLLVALGFIFYMILDRFVTLHAHTDDSSDSHTHHEHRGHIGAGSLSIHSFLDGAAIGLAFQVSPSVGIIVAIAVLVHDFSDGINTVNMVLKNKGSLTNAFKWLLTDAIAPVIGILSTLFYTLQSETLGIIMAIFAGFFLYIGASDLLPESHHRHPQILTTFMTILGMAVLYIAIKIAG